MNGMLKELIWGEKLYFFLRVNYDDGTEVYDWSVTDATLTLDGPDRGDGTPPPRFVFKHRPTGASDAGVTYQSTGVTFTKPTTWCEANLYRGEWDVVITAKSPTSDAIKLVHAKLPVYATYSGALDTDA